MTSSSCYWRDWERGRKAWRQQVSKNVLRCKDQGRTLSARGSQDGQMWTTTGGKPSTSALHTVLLVSEELGCVVVQPDWARGERFTLTQQHNGMRKRLNVNRRRGWGLQVLQLALPQALVWLMVHRTGNKTPASGFLAFTVNRQRSRIVIMLAQNNSKLPRKVGTQGTVPLGRKPCRQSSPIFGFKPACSPPH